MVLRVLISSVLLAIVGHTFYRLTTRYLDYKVSVFQQTANREWKDPLV